ncbi:YitT family protein, partial [Acinetobacter baumannii]|nr:YitT family protein [Acinetobacter baumannii]
MKLSGKKPWYIEYFLIIAGTGLMALAISSVFDSAGLVTGGFSGAAIIIKKWTESLIDGGIPL